MSARWPTLTVLLAVAALSGCTPMSTSVGSDDLRPEDAVLCRELGGGWVHIRYERGEVQGSRTGFGLQGDRGEDVPLRELEAAQQAREANGWDDAALDDLRRREGPSDETVARLERMPSCLAELRATVPSDPSDRRSAGGDVGGGEAGEDRVGVGDDAVDDVGDGG